MKTRHQLYIGGRWVAGPASKEIRFPFNDDVVAIVDQADENQIQEAIKVAAASFAVFKKTSRFARSRLLNLMASAVEKRKNEFVERLILEAGKPRGLAEGEVTRAIFTLGVAAAAARDFSGEIIPLDLEAGSRPYGTAQSLWFPKGPVLAITPFNFPLNLVIHKIAPAFAIGASVLLKPPPQAPGCAALLAEIFEKAAIEASDERDKIPAGSFQVVNATNDIISKAIDDPRLAILSFTGSDKVGWQLQGRAIRKKILLELGGNAAVIIHSDADLKRAAQRCATGGFGYAGQTCISVQRIYVQKSVEERFVELLKSEVLKLKAGDPREAGVTVGPLIDDHALTRIKTWIEEAKKDGAKLICGGGHKGRVMEPTIVTGVTGRQRLNCEEVFGPLVTVQSYENAEEAFEKVNASRFGLQAGFFTDSASLIQKAFDVLDVGGVIVNDVPTYRADNMPYGGVKDSGLGREGIRYAMEDYSERKILVHWRG